MRVVSQAEGFKIAYESAVAILRGTRLYKRLAELKEGQLVRFACRFIRDKNRGIKEASWTESGCMTFPEFQIVFEDVAKYPQEEELEPFYWRSPPSNSQPGLSPLHKSGPSVLGESDARRAPLEKHRIDASHISPRCIGA